MTKLALPEEHQGGGETEEVTSTCRRIAYVSLQSVEEGQDSWASVMEFIAAAQAQDWRVDRWFPNYHGDPRPSALRRAVEMFRLQRRLSHRLSDYDALYVRGHPFAWPLARAANKAGVAVIQECNGTYEDLFIAWPATRWVAPLVRSIQRTQYSLADGLIAVTEGLASWLHDETSRTDATVSPNGANVELFHPDARKREGLPERYAVFFGQLAPWQGIVPLLAAIQGDAWPDMPLVVVGTGVLRPKVEEAVSRGDAVIDLGRLPYADVPGIVAHAVASVVPMYDPQRAATGLSPLKLYESMACGVPVIASDTSGLADAVRDCSCGLIVPPGDSRAIAVALRTLAEDPRKSREMGLRGRACAVSHHSWRIRASQRLTIVEESILNRDRRRERAEVVSHL